MSPTARRTLEVAYVVLGSLVLGGATSYAQGLLPAAVSSLANSASGWTALTAVVVALARPRLALGAALGAVSFVCLVLGYTVVSELRGLAYDPLLWAAVGVLGGPFVGAAAASLCSGATDAETPVDRRTAALGSGLLAGILVGDAVYGLTVIAATTSPVYWTLCLVAAAVLLLTVAATRLRQLAPVAVQLATAVATAAAMTAFYAVIA